MVVKDTGLRFRQMWLFLLNFSDPQFPHLYNKGDNTNLIELL